MNRKSSVSRRDFLRAGAAATVAAAAVPALADGTKKDGKGDAAVLPKRKMGRTGVEVTILNQGCASKINQRHLNMVHREGIRYLDTADCYLDGASEGIIAKWLEKTGRRKEYYLVTKDHPQTPEQWVTMLDKRLEVLKTDYVDLYFIHMFGDSRYGGSACVKWLSDKAWSDAADRIRTSGKAKAVGFSTHCKSISLRTDLLNGAAKSGWVDAVMVATNPTVMRENAAFNKSLDACHKAGVGLVSMKECRGVAVEGIQEIFPSFKQKGLSAYTAILSAIWTDERFASICSAMDNVKILRENAKAARNFKPLTDEELAAVDDMLRRNGRTFCAACDGSCQRAGGTQADLNTIARCVSYAEEDGRLKEARELFASLPPEARNWEGADLRAASCACKSNLDFAPILAKAKKLLT